MKSEKIADIIIPHHNRHDMLKILLEGININIFNIIIISGGSFGYNCNKGSELAETDKLIFCNDDIKISSEQLIRITNCLNDYDFVGSTQVAGKKKKKYWGIGLFKVKDRIIHSISIRQEDSLFPSGFLFGIKKSVWEKMGKFNERYKTGNEDVDFGLRAIRAKLKMKILDLEIEHAESQSDERFTFCKQNEDLFYSMWGSRLERLYKQLYKK